jgi:hypothetical protein
MQEGKPSHSTLPSTLAQYKASVRLNSPGRESGRGESRGPNGGVAYSLDEAKVAFRAAVGGARPAESRPASAFAEKSGRDMLNLSLSVDDPSLP